MAPLVRTGGSRHTGLAAPPHRNIQDVREMIEAYQCLSPEKKRMLKVYMDMLLQYGGEL